MDQHINEIENNFKRSRRCTCELGKLRAQGKKSLRYSMCDVCSENLFSKRSKSGNLLFN